LLELYTIFHSPTFSTHSDEMPTFIENISREPRKTTLLMLDDFFFFFFCGLV
jgi:hypothetical protein